MEEEEKKWPGIIFSTLFILSCAVIGFFSAYYSAAYLPHIGLLDVLYTFLVIVISLPLHVILHELGHVLGGLASGYQFIMFRLFSTVWIKTEEGLSKRKQYIPGVMGQALMVPPESKQENAPFLLYHASGLLMNLVTAILFVVIGRFVSISWISFYLYVSAVVAILMMVMNAFPLQGTDGYNILQFIKRKESQKEITNSLYMYRDMVQGVSFKDLQKYISLESIDSLKDPSAATMYTVKAAYLIEERDFEGAHEIYFMLWTNLDELFEGHKAVITFDYLFTLLLTNPNHPDVEKIIQSKTYKQYEKVKQGDTLRVYATKALYLDRDFKEAKRLLDEGEKYLSSSPTLTEENSEKGMYQYLRKELMQMNE